MTNISPAPLAGARSSYSTRLSRGALAALLASAACPAFAQATSAEPALPTPGTTSAAQTNQTMQQSPSDAPGAPQADDIASPQTGATVLENAPHGPQDQQADQAGVEEIIVTATKRETNLQKTPIAISVANTQALADRHAQSLLDLGDGSIPSLRVATFEARQSALTVGIRGIVPFDQNQTARDVPVGTYIDGVYLARSQGLNASLLDIDRIEVLRGPQGTLFGRNTEGGAVSIITKAPSGEFGIRGKAGVGNYGSYDGQLHIDLPSFADLAIKLDGVVSHQGATVKNPLAGQYGWNYHHTVGGRVGARWTPFDGFTADLSYDITRDENTPNYSQLINYNPNGYNVGTYGGANGTTLFFNGAQCNVNVTNAATGAVTTTNPCIAPLSPLVTVSGGKRQDEAEIGVPQQPSVDKTHGVSASLKYKLNPDLELRSITAWRGVSTDQWDNSGGAHRTVFSPNGYFSRYSLSELLQKQFSQELQAVGSLPSIDYVVGAYYFRENVEEAAATPNTNRWNATGTGYTILSENGNGVAQPPFVCSNPAFPATPAQGWDRQNWCVQRHSEAKAKSFALFGQATWTPAGFDLFHLTVGARYTRDKRNGFLDVVSGNAVAGGAATLPVPFTFKFNNSRVDPLIVAAFDATPAIHLYAKYSTGYRAGGANARSATFAPFGPEVVKSFEVGSKMDLFDHLARLNLAAYVMKRSGTQIDFDNVDTTPGSPTLNLHTEETRNAPGTSTIKGLEADFTIRPTANLTLSASYAYTDSKIPPIPNPFIFGHPLFQVFAVYTPKHAASGAIDYELPVPSIAGGKWRMHLDANYATRQHSFQSEDVLTDPSFVVNANLSLADVEVNQGSARLTFSIWSRNLLDNTYIYRRSAANSTPTAVFNSAGVPTGALNYGGVLGDYGNFNPPRTFGAEIAFKVGAPRRIPAYVAPPTPPPPPSQVTCESVAVITGSGVCPPSAVPTPPPPPVERGERGE